MAPFKTTIYLNSYVRIRHDRNITIRKTRRKWYENRIFMRNLSVYTKIPSQLLCAHPETCALIQPEIVRADFILKLRFPKFLPSNSFSLLFFYDIVPIKYAIHIQDDHSNSFYKNNLNYIKNVDNFYHFIYIYNM